MRLGNRSSRSRREGVRPSADRQCFWIDFAKGHMRRLTHHLVEFLKREDGPTAVEYAVMLALIIVVCITAIATLGSNANGTFDFVGTKVSSSP
jgi:pilus assembly protein Flp/PilA